MGGRDRRLFEDLKDESSVGSFVLSWGCNKQSFKDFEMMNQSSLLLLFTFKSGRQFCNDRQQASKQLQRDGEES
jgi:hypothetical protein